MKWRYAWTLLALALVGCQSSGRDGGLRFRYRYDKENRLAETVENGSSTDYYYDKQGRLISVRYAKGRTDYGYSDEGLIWTKDAEGFTEYFRDDLGRVSDVLWRRTGEKAVHLDLDPWGGLTGVSVYSLPTGSGPLAEMVKVLRAPPSANEDTRKKRGQALLNFVAAAKATGDSFLEYSVRYDRDFFGRLTAMDSRAGRVIFTYRDEARETERRLPNGIRTVWRYTAQGQLESLVHSDASGREAASWTYSYDAAGLLTKVSAMLAGRPAEKQLERDSRGILRDVSASGAPNETWQYDPYGRPVREGEASLEWNKASQLAARTANGQRFQFEYDGRDLPIRASAERAQYRFRWDTEGRLDALSTPSGKYALLPDLTGTTGEPWMKWKVGGQAPTNYFSDGEVYAEVDARGEVRYLLRDGDGKVCLEADINGRLAKADGVGSGHRSIHLASFQVTPVTSGDSADESDLASRMATETAQMIAELKQTWDKTELRGWLFNTKVQNYVKDFLNSTPQTEVDYVFNGIGADWHDAWKDNDTYYKDKRGLFIPLFASIPKVADLPGCFGEKAASAIPWIGGGMQTRKVDLGQLLDQTSAAGKHVNSLTFESGAGFEEQRQVDELIRYSQAHPNETLPKILLVSTGADSADRQRLKDARYTVQDLGKDRFVGMVVDTGPAAAIPFVGKAISIPIQIAQAAWMGLPAVVSGNPRSLIEGHGFAAQSDAVLAAQANSRTAPLVELSADKQSLMLQDPSVGARKELGGVELGAKASAAGNIGTIRGVMYDKDSGRIALLGDHQIAADGLDAEDFAVALLMAYHDPPIIARFSLDPADPKKPDGKWMKAVYLPTEMLAGTRMGRTMFVTDWLMKQYSFGMSVDSDGRTRQLSALPGDLLDEFTICFRNWHPHEKTIWTRLWIVADDFRIQVHGSALTFETAKMRVRAKRQVVDPSSPTGLRDDERDVDESAREFAARFTANYDKLAEESPEFHRLRELAKAVALAKWLRESGVPVDLEWAQKLASRRSPYVDKVPTLTNQREQLVESSTRTRTISLTGGVDLAVMPLLMAEAPVAEEVEAAAMAPLRSEATFAVEAGEAKLEGAVLPVTRSGREAWAKAGKQIFGDATRIMDAGGRPLQLEYESGSRVVYSYPKGGQVGGARVIDPNGQVDVFQFGQEGKVVSGELRGNVKVAATHEADGSLGRLRLTTPAGERAEVAWGQAAGEATPEGGSRVTTVRGGHKVFRRYDARGNLVSLNVDGTHVASFAIDGSTTTAWSGQYSESATLSKDGASRIYSRTAPNLDGKTVTQVVKVPVERADRAMTAALPEGRLKLPSGNTMDVAYESNSAGSALEISQYPMMQDVVVGPNAATIDAQGTIRDGSKIIGRLGTGSAPVHVTLLDTPARVAELQSRFGSKTEFYLGTDRKLAEQNIARLPLVSNGSQVVTYLPTQHLVEDFGKIQSLRTEFTAMRVEDGMREVPEAEAAVLNGRASPEFKQWVEALGSSGALRGRVLFLNSCNGAADLEWNAELIRKYNLVATYSYMEEISAQAVQDVMFEFDRLLSVPRSFGESVLSLWRRAAEIALHEAKTDWLKQQIELLLKGLTQVSENGAGHAGEADLG